LTLSGHAWFAVHALTTWAWGLSPLEDQRLGGLLMWVPGDIVLVGYAVLLLGRYLSVEPKRVRSPPTFG
jgi:putative membrane protein